MHLLKTFYIMYIIMYILCILRIMYIAYIFILCILRKLTTTNYPHTLRFYNATVRVLLVPFINFHYSTTLKMIIVIIIKLHGAMKNQTFNIFLNYARCYEKQ